MVIFWFIFWFSIGTIIGMSIDEFLIPIIFDAKKWNT